MKNIRKGSRLSIHWTFSIWLVINRIIAVSVSLLLSDLFLYLSFLFLLFPYFLCLPALSIPNRSFIANRPALSSNHIDYHRLYGGLFCSRGTQLRHFIYFNDHSYHGSSFDSRQNARRFGSLISSYRLKFFQLFELSQKVA